MKMMAIPFLILAIASGASGNEPCRWYPTAPLPAYSERAVETVSLDLQPVGDLVQLSVAWTPAAGATTLPTRTPNRSRTAEWRQGDKPARSVQSVDFFENGIRLSTVRTPPYTLNVTAPLHAAAFTAAVQFTDSTTASSQCVPYAAVTTMQSHSNGIVVGRAKQFDERTLMEMLQSVMSNIDASSVIDMAAVRTALGGFQGGVSTTTAFGLSAMGPSLPATSTKVNTSSNTTLPVSESQTTTGGDSPGTTTTTKAQTGTTATASESTSATAATTPGPAPLSALTQTPYTLTPRFGYSAHDVLAEQTELAYQAMNLRMLLQRSLTDRLLIQSSGNGSRIEARSQPVLGFQVSVDPLTRYRGAVAEVMLTIRDRVVPRSTPPSLVALLPRDKTYNVATIRRGSAALSLGAVVQAVNVGVNAQRVRDTLYLVKDADTVALERLPETGSDGAVSFGWQFKPVLDQKSVSAGTRQVFAMLALPVGRSEQWVGRVEVNTRWRYYNRKAKTVGAVIPGSESIQTPYIFDVPPAIDHDAALRPNVHRVSWAEAPNERIVVTIDGEFPRSTKMTVGDRVIDAAADGMLVRTERRIVASLPATLFATSQLTLLDPYGLSAPVEHQAYGPGFRIDEVNGDVVGSDTTKIVLTLTSRDPSSPIDLDAPDHHLLALVGGRVVGFSGHPLNLRRVDSGVYSAEFTVPTSLAQTAGVVTVIDPLWGPAYVDTSTIKMRSAAMDTVAQRIVPLGIEGKKAVLALTGYGLDRNAIKVHVGNHQITGSGFKVATRTLLAFETDLQSAVEVEHAVVELSSGPALLLAMPPLRARPRIIRNESVTEGDNRRVRIEGADLQFLGQITYNGVAVAYSTDQADSTTGYLSVTPDLTTPAGKKTLVITAADGSRSSYELEVAPKVAEQVKK